MQPSVSSFDNPSALVSSELSPILMRRDGVAAAGRNDRLDGSFDQQSARFIAVISAIRNQAFRSATLSPATADASMRQRWPKEPDFRRRCLLHVYSERSTRAIGQYHKLCSLAFLSLPDQRTPLLAGMNMPSIKHSSQRSFCLSSNWSRKARHRSNSTPDWAHAFNLRWTVLFEPYRAGNSLHGAPAHRIHRMPSKHWRSSAGGRPPAVRRLRRGSCSTIRSHCSSVTARQAIKYLRDLTNYPAHITCQPVLG